MENDKPKNSPTSADPADFTPKSPDKRNQRPEVPAPNNSSLDPNADNSELYVQPEELSREAMSGPFDSKLFSQDGRGSGALKKKHAKRRVVVSAREPGAVSESTLRNAGRES